MGSKVIHERSIEFQLKVDFTGATDKTGSAATDAEIYARVQKAVSKAVKKHAGKARLKLEFPEPWLREGIRYDTDAEKKNGLFRRHNITLAIEASDTQTKFKCKQHGFIPELLYSKPKSALCYPRNKGRDAKLKLEQDIHFDNCKYCASGSLFLEGRRTDISSVADFSRLFPGIEQIAPPDTPLFPVSHWQETVCNKIVTAWRGISIEWDLVTRRDFQTRALLESELSYKLTREMKGDWDQSVLKLAAGIYLDLRSSGIFHLHPPIFYFHDPAAGVEINAICRDG